MVSDKDQRKPKKGRSMRGVWIFLLGALVGIVWERNREKSTGRLGIKPRPISELLSFDYIEDESCISD